MGNGGGAISAGGLQSSMTSNAGYPMLKCYSCHAQWTLDSSNDCVKTKITTTTIDCPSLSCESITISFQTTTDTNVLYYAWRGCTVNPEDGIIPNSIILNPKDYLEKKSSQYGKFQDLNIYVERSIQPGIEKTVALHQGTDNTTAHLYPSKQHLGNDHQIYKPTIHDEGPMFCYACGGERKVQKLTNPHYQVDYFNEDLDHCWIPNHITRSTICPGWIQISH